MSLDSLQQAWKAESTQTRITVDADLLLKEVQRNQREFRATIFRRDVVEVGVALLLLPYWFYAGATKSLPWTWYLTVPALIWIAGFILVDRIRHPQKPSKPGQPLLKSVKESLAQLEHQIWLLRNVFWWYLLPPGTTILAFFAHVSWLSAIETNDWLSALGVAMFLFAFLAGLYFFIYWLNQRCIRTDLEPRRQELLALLASLSDESTEELAARSNAKSLESSRKLRRWIIITVACLMTLVGLALASGLFDSSSEESFRSSGPAGDSLARLVDDLCNEKKLVAVASNGDPSQAEAAAWEIVGASHLVEAEIAIP